MNKIIIYKNGTTTNGKIFKVTSHEIEGWLGSNLLNQVRRRFGNNSITTFFTKDGHELQMEDWDLLQDGDVMYAAGKDEPFIPISGQRKPNPALEKTEGSNEIPKNSDFVKLNVGGTTFVTSKTTLINGDPNSILAKMFDPNSKLPVARLDENGAYLLDRDPKYFAPILNFLRTGTLVIDQGINPIGVAEEAVFFGIQACIPTGYVSRGKVTMQDALDQ